MKPTLLQALLAIATLAFVAVLVVLLRPGGDGWRRSRGRGRGERWDYPAERGGEASSAQLGSLTRKVSDLEKTLDRHAQQVQTLRTDVWQRVDALERRLGEAERRAAAAAREPARQPGPVDHGVETYGVTLRDPVPAWSSGGSGRPVEVRDGALVISHSLPPVAYAVPEGQGRARVFLNDAVEINEFALPKWEAFFEMHGARPYATYRTVRPAEVSWDAGAERGTPLNKGMAEAV